MDAVTEWVKITDWREARKGELAQLRRGDAGLVQGLVEHADGESVLLGIGPRGFNDTLGGGVTARREYKRDGFTLFVPAPPKVELPTEPGYYVDVDGDPWHLNEKGEWFLGSSLDEADPDFLPFTRLESRADTAKAVLERIREVDAIDRDGIDGSWCTALDRTTKIVAASYGVEL